MARSCSVCRHEEVNNINTMILEGVGTKGILDYCKGKGYPLSMAELINHRTSGHASRELTRQVLGAAQGPLSELAKVAIASKVLRVRKLDDLILKFEEVFEQRAQAYGHLPGGNTGLVGLRLKTIGQGANAREIEESFVDSNLIAEYRAVLEQAAKECGEWKPDGGEKAEATAQLAQSIVIHAAVEAQKLDQKVKTLDISATDSK